MEESVKNLWLDKIKSGKVAVIESHYAPKNNTNCIWLKDGQMYIYGNAGWESLGSGSGGGGGVIKLPVQFNTIETTGGGEDPDEPIELSVNPTRGNTKGPGSTVYYCRQKVSGDLFGPTENSIILDLAYYFGGGGPKGSDTRATKSDLDDVSHHYFGLENGSSIDNAAVSQNMLQMLGLDDDSSAKILIEWRTVDENDNFGAPVLSIIYKGSNYLYIVDTDKNPVLAQYYNNPDFRGITIMEYENGGDDDVPPAETA